MAPAASPLTKAVIATGGKQYIVSVGSEISVEKIVAEEGESITLTSVVMATDAKHEPVSQAALAKTSVTATVVAHGKGEKIRVFTFKSKKRQHRTLGHRQMFTRLQITAINAA